ncbi:hypothetical protein BDV23DRAFT_157029 [Aspergillus alliaceus]|uniref:Uncharacterized protein n=1 Tax=Petromyces alliaceus TaxID=209559 RepID=A0A5N7C647_PETAA|nr:hypothetical protein BDV23DRAFT_157029 [Aspergillus alliaceus]
MRLVVDQISAQPYAVLCCICDDPIHIGRMYHLYLMWRSNKTSNVESERRKTIIQGL